MGRDCRFSDVTKEYLTNFHCILEEMVQEMTEAELTGSISQNFISQMIPHHQAAIDMSRNILRYTTNIPLQDIALQIVEEQTRSIEDMCRIQNCCARWENCQRDVCLYQRRVNQILPVMFSGMANACTMNNINGDFMREMIPHHKGAIAMSENALRYEICQELVPVLEAIITSQTRGIRQMQALLRCIRD